MLGKITASALRDLGLDDGTARWAVTTINILTNHQRWFDVPSCESERDQAYRVLESWLKDDDVRLFLQVNRHQDVLWFNRETFEQLLGWMLLAATITIDADPLCSTDEAVQKIGKCRDVVQKLQQAKDESEYQIEKLLGAARHEMLDL